MDLLPNDVQIIMYRLIHNNNLKNLNNEYLQEYAIYFDDVVMYFDTYGIIYLMYRDLDKKDRYISIYKFDSYYLRVARLPKNY